ncbi:hypothetical protein BD779DRAFT_1675963 [Infundibulicybe gibba]|nr:hypothetical protein BD779DRAFT_1675963 [Infundibulicybe gibba]
MSSALMRVIDLNCAFFGYNSDEGFIVHIAQDRNVSALRDLVKKETEIDTPAQKLKLFEVDLSEHGGLAPGNFKRHEPAYYHCTS